MLVFEYFLICEICVVLSYIIRIKVNFIRARDVTQLAECLPNIHRTPGSMPTVM